LDETSFDASDFLTGDLFAPEVEEAEPASPALPADGRFAGIFEGYIVIPQPLIDAVVQYTEADPAAFGSYAAMGPEGSFELRHSDVVNSHALNTWPGVTEFYYGREKHLRPVLEALDIPIIPLKRDFLHAYERVITELGQL
jgi:hypothetical protein